MSKQEKRSRRRYTAEERGAILRDVDELGLSSAARKHGVPTTTVFNWKKRRQGTGPDKPVTESTTGATSKPHRTEKAKASVARTSSTLTKGVARRYTPSEKAQALELAAAHGVMSAAQQLKISRFTIYAWQHKARKAAVGEGPSITTGPTPTEITDQRDREILTEWKKHPGLGPSQIKNQLRRTGVKVGVHTVRRVMEDAGYRPPKIRRHPHDNRYEAVRPNHMWHLDFVHRFIQKVQTWTLILIDDCSRYVVGHGVDDRERVEMVIATFEEAVRRHGKPESVLNDKGSAFWSWRGIGKFTALLTEMGVDQVVAEAKEHNGKVENFNGNLHKELFDKHRFWDVSEMKHRLGTHLHWYNHARTHQALGGLLVPADRYYGRAEEVLARIESGALSEGNDLGLGERCLEFFKVTSRGGTPEIWLMGQRLMPAPARE